MHGAKDGAYRATFEDKPLLSDIVFLRAWIALDLPRFYNPVTNLLAAAPTDVNRPPKNSKRVRGGAEPEQAPTDVAAGMVVNAGTAAAADATAAAAAPGKREFQASSTFTGPRPGMAFKLGPQGQGYYKDEGPTVAAATAAAAHAASAAAKAAALASGSIPPADGAAAGGAPDSQGWVGLRTVADLRRALGTGAPRASDSLYRDIERAPRKFNPLKVPKALQAALPFKSKPKLEPSRKRKTLEQKRAVVMDKGTFGPVRGTVLG